VAAPRERPDRIASTIFAALAVVCALTGLLVAVSVESHPGLTLIVALFQTLLFGALAAVAHDVEDIKYLVRGLPAPQDAIEGGAPADASWSETWRLHDQLEERD
jgi:hypothetical protein